MLEIIDPLRNAISILESNSQGYHTNRDKIPIRRAQSQTTMSPSTVTIPSIKRENGGGEEEGGIAIHGISRFP